MGFSKHIYVLLLLTSCQSFVTGKTRIQDFAVKDREATVLFWWATQCPCVTRFQSRMEDLAESYAGKSVAMFAVASNADESLEQVQRISQQRQFKLPIIFDKNGVLAKQIGVYTTPTAVLLDSEGEVQFMGWIDNERMPGEKDRVPYLQNALDQFLNQEKITMPRAPIYGCPITKTLF
ncbi:MAG: redoxin domain-containing protein [Myxococcaceae bacterium]